MTDPTPAEMVLSVHADGDWTELRRLPHVDPIPDLTTRPITVADIAAAAGDHQVAPGDRYRIAYVDAAGVVLRAFVADVDVDGVRVVAE